MCTSHAVRVVGVCALASCAILDPIALAAGKTRGPAKIDREAEQVIRALAEHLAATETLSVDVSVKRQVVKDDGPAPLKDAAYHIALQRPNKVAVVTTLGRGSSLYADGKKVFQYAPSKNGYQRLICMSEVLKCLQLGTMGTEGFCEATLFAANLLSGLPYEELIIILRGAEHLGKDNRGEMDCHHLRLSLRTSTCDLWVTPGEDPLIREIQTAKAVSHHESGAGKGGWKKREMTVSLTYENWRINPELPEETFVFAPPEGAKELKVAQKPRRCGLPRRPK